MKTSGQLPFGLIYQMESLMYTMSMHSKVHCGDVTNTNNVVKVYFVSTERFGNVIYGITFKVFRFVVFFIIIILKYDV